MRQVLTGLRNDDRYTTTVKVITYSSELPDLTKLTEMLVEEERQLELATFFLLNWLHSGAQIQLKSTPQPCGTW